MKNQDVKSMLDQLPDEAVAQELKHKHEQIAKLVDATLTLLIDRPQNKTLADNLKTYNAIYENNLARIMSYINAQAAIRDIVVENVTPVSEALNIQYQQLIKEVNTALTTVINQPQKEQAVRTGLNHKVSAFSNLMNRELMELGESLFKAFK